MLGGALDANHPNLVAVSRFLAECHERLANEEGGHS